MEPSPRPVFDVLGCRDCPKDRVAFVPTEGAVRCPACSVVWPVGPHDAVNSLTEPAESVVREIDGMRSENPSRYPTRDSFLFQCVERVSRFEDRIAAEANAAKNYYESTALNFRYAYDKLKISGSERVLEVGAEHDFPFLKPFRENGCDCYATNLFFCYEATRSPGAQVVLGDMNRLPYRNEMFDVVVASATSHHSPDLPGLLAEFARVTRPSGYVLLLNDPTSGAFKHALDRFGFGTQLGGSRHDLVNENEYSVAAYRRLAKAAGFAITESFFSVYYDRKLRSGNVRGVRFAPLAKLVSLAWRIAPLRWILQKTALYPAQMLIGLELNMILQKHSG